MSAKYTDSPNCRISRSAPVNTGVSWCKKSSQWWILFQKGIWSEMYPSTMGCFCWRYFTILRSVSAMGMHLAPKRSRSLMKRRSNHTFSSGWYICVQSPFGSVHSGREVIHSQLQKCPRYTPAERPWAKSASMASVPSNVIRLFICSLLMEKSFMVSTI